MTLYIVGARQVSWEIKGAIGPFLKPIFRGLKSICLAFRNNFVGLSSKIDTGFYMGIPQNVVRMPQPLLCKLPLGDNIRRF